jgi:hypothetical protein
MQVRSRGVAAITALLFVACGVLAMHHEASTPHVRDLAGGFVHARAMTGHHVTHDSDIHGQRDPDGDAGACALLTAFHQAASADIAAPAVIATVRTLRAQDTLCTTTTTAATDVYRLAPKTSPPFVV